MIIWTKVSFYGLNSYSYQVILFHRIKISKNLFQSRVYIKFELNFTKLEFFFVSLFLEFFPLKQKQSKNYLCLDSNKYNSIQRILSIYSKKKNFFDSCDEIVEVIQIVIKFENFIQKFWFQFKRYKNTNKRKS